MGMREVKDSQEGRRGGKGGYGEVATLGAPPPQFMKAITARRQ